MSKTKKSAPIATAKVLIVDDHPAAREGLALRIAKQADMQVCGEAGELAEALQLVGQTHPDVAIIDLTLKNGHGLELIKRIKARYPNVRILVWSMHPEALYAERALHAGALGYVNKEHATEEIIAAIHRVLEGKYYLSETLAERLLTHSVEGPLDQSPFESLSDRELETFELLGQGLSTNQVAAKMRLSSKTVETYRARIKEKLHLSNGPELMRRAMQWVLENR